MSAGGKSKNAGARSKLGNCNSESDDLEGLRDAENKI